jgi:tetratricopeptide (TPR) repeat protein
MGLGTLALALALGVLQLQVGSQSGNQGSIVPRADAGRSKQSMLLMALQRALARDNVEQAAEQIEELLAMGTAPVTVFHHMRAAATPRGVELLPSLLSHQGSTATELEQRELVLLLYLHAENEAATDSLIETWKTEPSASEQTLSAAGATARASGNMPAALWAYEELRRHYGPVQQHIVVPLAECLVYEGRINEAIALLDSLLASQGVPKSLRDQARLLQARLVFQCCEETSTALDLLSAITDRRARTEAELLMSLIRFLTFGSDSAAHRLERAARMRPDIKEANDAFDLARLTPLLPHDRHERDAVLGTLRLDIRQQWESAGHAYLRILPSIDRPLFTSLAIRAARCLEEAGEFEKALEIWNHLTESADDSAIALLGKGDCQAAMGLSDSAKVTYMSVLRQYPESPHAARARSRLLD